MFRPVENRVHHGTAGPPARGEPSREPRNDGDLGEPVRRNADRHRGGLVVGGLHRAGWIAGEPLYSEDRY